LEWRLDKKLDGILARILAQIQNLVVPKENSPTSVQSITVHQNP
jgi:hypothetical protein